MPSEPSERRQFSLDKIFNKLEEIKDRTSEMDKKLEVLGGDVKDLKRDMEGEGGRTIPLRLARVEDKVTDLEEKHKRGWDKLELEKKEMHAARTQERRDVQATKLQKWAVWLGIVGLVISNLILWALTAFGPGKHP